MVRVPKILSIPLLTVIVASTLVRCSKSNDVDDPPAPPDPQQPYLTVTQELPTSFDPTGGSAALVFSTNESWQITVEPSSADPGKQTSAASVSAMSPDSVAAASVSAASADSIAPPRTSTAAVEWYEITPTSGAAGKDIAVTVRVDPNEEYTARGVTLVLRSTTHEKRIDLVQLKKNAIIADQNRREISSEGQTLTVKVQSNVTYGVEVTQGREWIVSLPRSRAGGLEESEHRFTISANPDNQERTGVVVFRDADSDLSDEVTIVQAAFSDPDPERTALKAIYAAAGGNSWTHKENWGGDKPLAEWYGVETDDAGHVTALRLSKNNLVGTISEKIAALTRLRHLDMSRNALGGPISVNDGKGHMITSMDDLTELETIDLSHNCIEGGFLPDWNNLNKLQTINLSFNKIKSWFQPWAHLFQSGREIDLILNNNNLYGEVPDVIQNHPQWSRLGLQLVRQNYEGGGGISYKKDIILPNFTFTDLRDGSQGSMRDVYSSNTRTMVLAWNPTQEASNTFLETTVRRFHTLYGGQGFAVVVITPEGDEYREAAQAYLRTHEMPGPVVTDYADAQGRRIVLPAEPYPSYFLVDQYGKFSNDMFTGQYCSGSLYPEEPFLIDLTERPFQHTDNLNKVFKDTFGNSTYQSTDFSMDKKFETLQRATKGKGIDIVLIGEAYTDVDIASGYYKQVIEFAMESFFAIEPMKSYRDYFNVHMVYAVSRDAYIRTNGGNTALSVTPQNKGWFYINTAIYYLPDYYQVVTPRVQIPTVGVVINGRDGGVTQIEPYLRPSCAFTGFGNRRGFRESITHETVGHGLGWLGDEYIDYVNGVQQGEIPESEKKNLRAHQQKGLFLNLSLTDDPKSVYWSHLIGHSRYPYVGFYLGGYYYSRGVWHSESRSLMDEPTDYYFSAICRELIVKRILELSGEGYTFEKFLAKDSDEGRTKSSTSSPQQRQEQQRVHQPPIIGELNEL